MTDDLELLAGRLVTSRYQTWRPGHGVPIRSTVGAPRFWRHGPLPFIRQLAPWGLLSPDLDPAEFDRRYLARLDRDADAIVASLTELAHQHPGERLVVLCYEDVWAGQICHRRTFAEWFRERYAIEVPEVAHRR